MLKQYPKAVGYAEIYTVFTHVVSRTQEKINKKLDQSKSQSTLT